MKFNDSFLPKIRLNTNKSKVYTRSTFSLENLTYSRATIAEEIYSTIVYHRSLAKYSDIVNGKSHRYVPTYRLSTLVKECAWMKVLIN